MKQRHLAQIRLSRAVPGETAGELRAIPARLHERPTSLVDEPADLLVRSVSVWDRRPVPMASFRLPDVGPYSPLLKRIVRHPYAYEPSGPRRVQRYDASRPALESLSTTSPRMVFRSVRDAVARESFVDHTPETRALPFSRRRAALDEQEEAR